MGLFKTFRYRSILDTLSKSVFTILVLLLAGCATQKPSQDIYMYRFTHDGNDYRIRSIVVHNGSSSYNELIGNDFLATDYNQDRVIDQVKVGDVTVAEAQAIYDAGLEKVVAEDKMKVNKQGYKSYSYTYPEFVYEIRSFQPANDDPFIELKAISRTEKLPEPLIFIDYKADGSLDEVLKGSANIGDFQSTYEELLEKGINKGHLKRKNGIIVVRSN